jgi:DnaJ-domain-containing protein 1
VRERRELFAKLIEFALCDGFVTPDEEDALRVIKDLLQISSEAKKAGRRVWASATKPSTAGNDYAERRERDSRQRTSAWTRDSDRPAQSERPTTHWSYEYLGCSEQDSDETIKRSYRRLAVKLHPDKHAARSAISEEAIKHIRAFQKLQAAYEAVWKLRGTVHPKR